MKTEYQKTLHEANELFDQSQRDKIVNKLPPCQEEKSKVCLKKQQCLLTSHGL